MSETEIRESSKEPDEEKVLIAKLAAELFSSSSYTNLKEEDLRNQGMIQPDESLEDFIKKQLGLRETLQPAAISSLLDELPPSSELSEEQETKTQVFFTPEEESYIRRAVLGSENNQDVLSALADSEEMIRFTYQVFESIGSIEDDGETSFDINKLASNLDRVERTLRRPPRTLEIRGEKYFALSVPKESESSGLGSIIGAMMGPSLSHHLIVSDPERNRALTSQILKTPELMRYYLAKHLREQQEIRKTHLTNEFRTASLKKYEQIETEVKEYNLPFQRHAFNLLLKEASAGELELNIIFRDRHDADTIKGKAEPKLDRVGTESSDKFLTLRSEEPGVLSFFWNYQKIEYVSEDGERVMKRIPTREQADVRFNEETNSFELRSYKNDQANEWVNKKEYDGSGWVIKTLLDRLSIVTHEQRTRIGTDIYQEANLIKRELEAIQNPIELFMKLREYQLAGYPNNEFILSKSGSADLPIVELFTDKPETRWQ